MLKMIIKPKAKDPSKPSRHLPSARNNGSGHGVHATQPMVAAPIAQRRKAAGRLEPMHDVPSGAKQLAGQVSPEAQAMGAGQSNNHQRARARMNPRTPLSAGDDPQQEAIIGTKPTKVLPPAAAKRQRSKSSLKPSPGVTAGANSGETTGGQLSRETHSGIAPIVVAIQTLRRELLYARSMRIAIDNAILQLIRHKLGWRVNYDAANKPIRTAPELAKRKKIEAMAAALYKAVRSGKPAPKGAEKAAEDLTLSIHAAAISRSPHVANEDALGKKIDNLVHQLPVWTWSEKINGIGPAGIGIIIGETGDLTKYSNPGKVWKRLGLAPHDGRAGSSWKSHNGKLKGEDADPLRRKLSAEEWVGLGYSQKRRSASFIVCDSLLKCKKGSKYRDMYYARRAYEAEKHPELCNAKTTKKSGKLSLTKHGDLRARRIAEKEFVKDLWIEWRRTDGADAPKSEPWQPQFV